MTEARDVVILTRGRIPEAERFRNIVSKNNRVIILDIFEQNTYAKTYDLAFAIGINNSIAISTANSASIQLARVLCIIGEFQTYPSTSRKDSIAIDISGWRFDEHKLKRHGILNRIISGEISTKWFGRLFRFDEISEDVANYIEATQEENIRSTLDKRLVELDWSVRTESSLMNAGILFLGELSQNTEAALLRIPNFGRKSLLEVRDTLKYYGLNFGMVIPTWRAPPIEGEADIKSVATKVKSIEQQRLGARFRPNEDVFEINYEPSEDDEGAANDIITKQLHYESLRKLREFSGNSRKLDNQPGWNGIDSLNRRFVDLLDRPTSEIPAVIGFVYGAAVELGSFLELDNKVRLGSASYIDPLEPEVRRPLEDLIRTVAPWVRRFPSAKELDDETGQFLSQASLVESAEATIKLARNADLIRTADAEILQALLDAARRGERLGEKAGTRGVLSVRNLAIAAASVASTIFLGAVASDVATKSVLVQRVGTFLVTAETSIMELVADLPPDLRLAFEGLIRHVPEEAALRPEPPSVNRPGRRI